MSSREEHPASYNRRCKKPNKRKPYEKRSRFQVGKCIVDYSLTASPSTYAHTSRHTHQLSYLSFLSSLLPSFNRTHIDNTDTGQDTRSIPPALQYLHTLSPVSLSLFLPSRPPPKRRTRARRKRGEDQNECRRLVEATIPWSRGGEVGFGISLTHT